MSTVRSPRARNGERKRTPALEIAMQALIGTGLLAAAAACTSPRLQPVSGADTFGVHCAGCHGPLAEGDGPDAEQLRLSPPNLRTLARRHGGVFPADEVASYIDGTVMPTAHGERNMPVWGPVFDATSRIVPGADAASSRIDAVIEYLRSLQTE